MSERKSVGGSSASSVNVALEQNLVLASSTKGLALVEVCIFLLDSSSTSFLSFRFLFFSAFSFPAPLASLALQVIKQVLSNPYIFAFGDFLAIQNVKQACPLFCYFLHLLSRLLHSDSWMAQSMLLTCAFCSCLRMACIPTTKVPFALCAAAAAAAAVSIDSFASPILCSGASDIPSADSRAADEAETAVHRHVRLAAQGAHVREADAGAGCGEREGAGGSDH